MKPTLSFEMREMPVSELGEESSLPDLLGGLILQNGLEFYLDEEDEIFEGYGTKTNSFPYRQYNSYTRKLSAKKIKLAILENDYIQAVFLPEFGGRLWELTDKTKGENLLYTNDVIRFSNLSVRNAWFSGGVEWNIGVIGHTPLTTDSMFTAKLQNAEGSPVLRMYEYERVRGVEYQMDFWLGEKDTFLNCRMRIVNSSKEVIPMYWWSNMAVPEYEEGSIVVPAEQAYTYRDGGIYKVGIPIVDGVDITHYNSIPKQVDYFFNIPKESPKYIVNMNKNGYGLLQMSTQRLISRKLFSWGNNTSSDRWQEFLTEGAGKYVEIQAGIGKTQYGCVPMPPHTAWEWLEQYGAVQLTEAEIGTSKQPFSFQEREKEVTKYVKKEEEKRALEGVLKASANLAKTSGELVYQGSGYGALKNICREYENDRRLSEHLAFENGDEKLFFWAEFLRTGYLPEPDTKEPPQDFSCDDIFYQLLADTIEGKNKENWYAHYQIGLFYFTKKEWKRAEEAWECSLRLQENAWAYHALACLYIMEGKKEEAALFIKKGLALRGACDNKEQANCRVTEDISFVKECFKILLLCEDFKGILTIYEILSESLKKESRILFGYLKALYKTGSVKEAYELLTNGGGLILEDIREGEDSIGQLWAAMHEDLYHEKAEIPYVFQFNSFL